MKLKSKIKLALSSMALLCAVSSHAFSPANGAWSIDTESGSSAPGRGFSIEVENEVLVFTYFGYRADGSSVFYVAAGAMTGNTFTGVLNETKGGTVLGGAYKGGTTQGTPGSVKVSFTSGVKGTITLPGESPKAVSKLAFGYSSAPTSLLGTYLLAYTTSAGTIADTYTLTNATTTVATTNGNGLVTNTAKTFLCENQISGTLVGVTVCTESTGSNYDDGYVFRMAGDRGTGVGTYTASPNFYPSTVIRILNKSGKATGINDGTTATLAAFEPGSHLESLNAARQSRQPEVAKTLSFATDALNITLSEDEQIAVKAWNEEARRLMPSVR